jgi:alkylation response protein AidB-like acyl-CoA dehydrogenase
MTTLIDRGPHQSALEAALVETDTGASPETRLAQLVAAGLMSLPLPGDGRTAARFASLRALGRHELSLARLAEGHADALAILAEAHAEAPPGARLGVWAAGPVESLAAKRRDGGWRLDGVRRWCSGAPSLTHALVRASSGDGERLFLVALEAPGVRPIPGSWPAIGMAGSMTLDVEFRDVEVPLAAAVGRPGFYLARSGFWCGAAGVAAVWLGGAEAVAAAVAPRAGEDPHRLAHLGAITARLTALDALLATVAGVIDSPDATPRAIERLARILRAEIERGATDVLERTGRATGAEPLCHDPDHARRVVDLGVYLRQSHAESDLAEIGMLERSLRAEEGVEPGER